MTTPAHEGLPYPTDSAPEGWAEEVMNLKPFEFDTNPANEWREETKDKIYELLHNFHRECLKEPYEGQPLLRRARKNEYVDKIYSLLDTERARILERFSKEIAIHKEIMRIHEGVIFPKSWHEGQIQAFDQAIDIVKDNK